MIKFTTKDFIFSLMLAIFFISGLVVGLFLANEPLGECQHNFETLLEVTNSSINNNFNMVEHNWNYVNDLIECRGTK